MEWGMSAGLGVIRTEDLESGFGAVLGMNLSKNWMSLGVRFSIGDRESLDARIEDGTILDLGLMVVGARGRFRRLHAALRAGPAVWGVRIEDLADFELSLAAQGELMVYASSKIGVGAIVAYNLNDVREFWVVTIGVGIGPR
jgi:hypothetical protein